MNGKMMNDVMGNMKEMYDGAMDELGKTQSTPIGTTERTKRERSHLWKEIMALDKETSSAIMTEMATMAGHKSANAMDTCEFCKFVKENIGK